MRGKKRRVEPDAFATTYPFIADWVRGGGWIELGRPGGGYSRSFVAALDEGGVIYEGDAAYKTLDQALRALEQGIQVWLEEMG